MSDTQPTEPFFFVRNKNGQGFSPTARGRQLLLVWDIASWVVIAGVVVALIMRVPMPWWAYVLLVPFAAAPFLGAMFFTGRGPIGALLHYGRRKGR